MYQEKLRELGKLGLIGVGIGFFAAIATSSGVFTTGETIFFAFMMMGAPYGWIVFGKIFPWFIIGSLPVMAIGLMIRVVFSVIAGWFLYPIALIYTAIRANIEKRGI